jgi:hypothetical protein
MSKTGIALAFFAATLLAPACAPTGAQEDATTAIDRRQIAPLPQKSRVPKSGEIGHIIVGVPPGSNLDATARILAEHMSETGAQRYIVLNRPGAGGAIGAEVVARSPADGMTLILSPISTMVTVPQVTKQDVRYDPLKDFAPSIERILNGGATSFAALRQRFIDTGSARVAPKDNTPRAGPAADSSAIQISS